MSNSDHAAAGLRDINCEVEEQLHPHRVQVAAEVSQPFLCSFSCITFCSFYFLVLFLPERADPVWILRKHWAHQAECCNLEASLGHAMETHGVRWGGKKNEEGAWEAQISFWLGSNSSVFLLQIRRSGAKSGNGTFQRWEEEKNDGVLKWWEKKQEQPPRREAARHISKETGSRRVAVKFSGAWVHLKVWLDWRGGTSSVPTFCPVPPSSICTDGFASWHLNSGQVSRKGWA